MAVKDQKTDNAKFTWRIENFSKLKSAKLCSQTFSAGGQKWTITVYPKGKRSTDHLPVYLLLTESETSRDGRNVMNFDFSLTLVNQSNSVSSLRKCGKQPFIVGGRGWGFSSFIETSKLLNPDEGFIVNDTVTIEARVSMETFTDQSDSVTKERPNKECIAEQRNVADDQPNATVLNSATDQPDSIIKELPNKECIPEQRNAADDQPNAAVLKSATEVIAQPEGPGTPLSSQVAGPPDIAETTQNPDTSPCVHLTSRNLRAELSTVTSNLKSPAVNGSTLLLQQQREKMVGYLNMSLEAIHKTDLFEDVEETALLIADPTDTGLLKGLFSELKKGVSGSISIIETSNGIETSVVQMSEDMEARLAHRQKQLSCLEGEVSRLGEEEKKLDVEIQQLIARKFRVRDQKRSTVDELGKASEEASKELEEVKEQSNKRKRASENRLVAEENLAQFNTSWKVVKYALGL